MHKKNMIEHILYLPFAFHDSWVTQVSLLSSPLEGVLLILLQYHKKIYFTHVSLDQKKQNINLQVIHRTTFITLQITSDY